MVNGIKNNTSSKNIIIILAIVLIIASGISGYMLGQNSMKKYKNVVDDLFPEQTEVYSVSGTISSLSSNSLTITAAKPGKRFLPGEEMIYVDLQVSISSGTSIIELNPFSAYMEEQEKKISFSELSEGDIVSVDSEEDIIGKTEIIATIITKNSL